MSLGEREQQEGLNVMAQDQTEREKEEIVKERRGERPEKLFTLLSLVTLLWLLSSSHAMDFLKLLHHRPSCQSWVLIGWEELPWLLKLHSSASLA